MPKATFDQSVTGLTASERGFVNDLIADSGRSFNDAERTAIRAEITRTKGLILSGPTNLNTGGLSTADIRRVIRDFTPG